MKLTQPPNGRCCDKCITEPAKTPRGKKWLCWECAHTHDEQERQEADTARLNGYIKAIGKVRVR
jgi:hypothetical protein